MENNTAKNFVLQLGSIICLYLSVSFLIVLVFGLINLLLPDATETYWQVNSTSDMVRFSIAMVAVFGPTYIILKKNINEARRENFAEADIALTKWLIYASILVGGIVLLGNAVAVIINFLEGEMTLRFTLKAAALFVIIGATLFYYVQDIKGYWLKHVNKSRIYGLAVISTAMFAVFVGFFHINSPSEVRELRFDETQISDLREIQWRIQDELVVSRGLPVSLDDLDGKTPTAPESRPDYLYEKTEVGFKLCATFFGESTGDDDYFGRPIPVKSDEPIILNAENWQHEMGESCFERVVRFSDEEM